LLPEDVESSLGSFFGAGAGWIAGIVARLWASGHVLFGALSVLIVTPVVAFYLLLDWHRLLERVDSWLPRDHAATIRRRARDMNAVVAGSLRGQLGGSLILGTAYAITLSIVGLNFALFIGLGAGIIGFIPFVGAFVGGAVAIGVAIVQFAPDWTMIAIVAAIFLAGQGVEGYILQPKLV